MWAASIAINPAQAIANKKIDKIRLSKASFSGSGSPGRVLSARPLQVVVDVKATPPIPSRGELPANPSQIESAHFLEQHTPFADP